MYRFTFKQCILLASHAIVAWSESNHSAIGPLETSPKRSFLPSCTVFTLYSVTAGLLPNEKLISFSNKRVNAVGSSLESIPINFSNAKSGYATVFAIFYLTSLVAPNMFNFVLFAIQLAIQVASTWFRFFVYRLITKFYCDFVITLCNNK